MTVQTADPAAVLATAGHDLLAALSTLVAGHPDGQVAADEVPGLLDDVTTLLRRIRGRVARAQRAERPAAERQPTPQPAAKAPTPMPPPAPAKVAETRTAPAGDKPGVSPSSPSQQPQQPSRSNTSMHPNQPNQPWPGAMPQMGPPPPRLRRKRRRWPWVIVGACALLFVFILVIGVAAGGGTSPRSASPTPAQQPVLGGPVATTTAATADLTVYEVIADGGTAMITYTTANFNISQENGAALPWRKEVNLGRTIIPGGSLSAQGDGTVGSITCRVSRGGKEIASNTSTGKYAVVTCSGF